MVCPKCGKENAEGAWHCAECGALLTQGGTAQAGATARPAQPVKTSGLAIAALVLGILGFVTCGITALIGLVLGIIALVNISRSKGQLGGEGMAIVAVSLAGVLVVVAPIMGAIVYPVFFRARETARRTRCLSTEHQLALAVIMYATDHNDTLPPADKWCDAIMPYVKARGVFVCPNARDRTCGYAFNRALGSRTLKSIRDPAATVVMFESDVGWSGSGGIESLPPGPRHLDFDALAFLDGHVRTVPRSEAAQLNWSP